MTVSVREARPDEYDAIGELTVAAYSAFPEIVADSGYFDEIRDVVRRAVDCLIFVAVDGDGTVLGGATYVAGPDNPYSEVERDGEAGIRMLAVAPTAQRRGIGTSLAAALIDRARTDGRNGMALLSLPSMTAAHAMYERLGFSREPSRDWEFRPGEFLICFTLPLD
ncbi:MAG: GNAT family N-acetyltransferase [Candidatus Limnocylindrales bacterium]